MGVFKKMGTDIWKGWEGKYVFIRTKYGKVYSGRVINVDIDIPRFLTLLDKFHKQISFSISEITVIQEEEVNVINT